MASGIFFGWQCGRVVLPLLGAGAQQVGRDVRLVQLEVARHLAQEVQHHVGIVVRSSPTFDLCSPAGARSIHFQKISPP